MKGYISKLIEEDKKNKCNDHAFNYSGSDEQYETNLELAKYAYQDGIDFMTNIHKWRNIVDELPNLHQLVLVKYQTDEVTLATYTGGLHSSAMFKQKCDNSTFGTRAVQWKPILL